MFKIIYLLLITIFISLSANAATKYISEDLYIFMHSGPSTQYKIIGSLNSGEHIETVREESNFTLIKDSKNRNGWINSKYISEQIGLKDRLPKIESELTKLKIQLEEYDKSIESKINQISKLEDINSDLSKQLKEITVLNNALNEKLDTKRTDLLMRWFTYGGMVAGAGLLLGLILPLLIPKRRNRNRW